MSSDSLETKLWWLGIIFVGFLLKLLFFFLKLKIRLENVLDFIF